MRKFSWIFGWFFVWHQIFSRFTIYECPPYKRHQKGWTKTIISDPRGGAISIKAPLGGDINVANPGFGSDDHPKHFRSSWSDLQPSRLYECQSSTDTKSESCECHRCSLQHHCLQRCIHWPSHLQALCACERSNASAPGRGERGSVWHKARDD